MVSRASAVSGRLGALARSDDGTILNQLPVWAPDPALRRKILVDNSARLYDF